MVKHILITAIRLYKVFISPILTVYLGHSCRYTPTCSVYACDALEKYGARGVGLVIRRILRCNWRSEKYFDPVL